MWHRGNLNKEGGERIAAGGSIRVRFMRTHLSMLCQVFNEMILEVAGMPEGLAPRTHDPAATLQSWTFTSSINDVF